MHKRGHCRQYILISGQQLVSDLSVMQAGTPGPTYSKLSDIR